MRYTKPLALTLGVLLIISASTFTLPVKAEENIRSQMTLGIKRGDYNEPTGDPDSALPNLVRVGETHLIYGRLMQLPTGKNLQPLPDAEVKLIDVFNNAQNPVVLATAKSDEGGYFVFEWKVSIKKFKELGEFKLVEGLTGLETVRLQVLGIYDGDSTHAKSTSRGYIVNLKSLRLDVNIKTDKQLYTVNESAEVTVTFKDATGQLIDPDTLEIFLGSDRISPVHESVGTYFFATPPLSEKVHKVTVLADKEEYLKEIKSATIIVSAKADLPVDLNIELDRGVYGLGDLFVITGTVKPVMEGRVVLINVVNPNGAVYNFGHVTPGADGTFEHKFRLVGQLAVTGEWKATLTYLGSQVTKSFSVEELSTKFLQVVIQSSSVVNDLGEILDEGLLGSPVGIQTELANNENEEVALTYIVQITDADGFTVMVSWIKGIVLKPNTGIKPAIFWIPDEQGDYNVEIFVWESLQNPVPLSAPTTLEINVA